MFANTGFYFAGFVGCEGGFSGAMLAASGKVTAIRNPDCVGSLA